MRLDSFLIDGGYYDVSEGKCFFYLTDHLGNVRVVADEQGADRQVMHYYPFGSAFMDGKSPGLQPYKYNGKEQDKMHGLNLYDYHARHYDSAIDRFTTIDPLAEKYYNISPYVYVANNPMKFIDPDGKRILPWQYKSYGTNAVKGLSKDTEKALSICLKTAEGFKTMARYASKGDVLAGHTFTEDGVLSDHLLHIQDLSFTDDTQKIPADYRGLMKLDPKKEGESILSLYSYMMKSDEILETIAHELNLHGIIHEDKIEGKVIPTEKQDHEALRSRDLKHPGYRSYLKVINQSIKTHPHLEDVFKKISNEYKHKYKKDGSNN